MSYQEVPVVLRIVRGYLLTEPMICCLAAHKSRVRNEKYVLISRNGEGMLSCRELPTSLGPAFCVLKTHSVCTTVQLYELRIKIDAINFMHKYFYCTRLLPAHPPSGQVGIILEQATPY